MQYPILFYSTILNAFKTIHTGKQTGREFNLKPDIFVCLVIYVTLSSSFSFVLAAVEFGHTKYHFFTFQIIQWLQKLLSVLEIEQSFKCMYKDSWDQRNENSVIHILF